MATAAKNARPHRDVARAADAVPQTTTIEFLIYEDNSGGYRWTIFGSGAESLAQSRTFPRYEDARRAASEPHVRTRPVGLLTRLPPRLLRARQRAIG